jgi:hypothetical protein
VSKVSAYTLAIAVSLGTTAMLDNSQPPHKLNASAEARLQGDGAFLDGLYLGKLAAESGQLQHPAIARQSTGPDRARFTVGHRRGYSDSLAHTEPWSNFAKCESGIEVKFYAGKKLLTLFAFTLSVCLSWGMCVVATRLARTSGAPPNTAATDAPNLKGTVRFEGVVPKPKVVSMAADPSCAKQHPSPVFAQVVMTDAQRDLQNVSIFVADGLGDRTFHPPSLQLSNRKVACTCRMFWRCGQTSHCTW